MSSPLFKTEGSVWRTGAQVLLEGDEEDEDWVDQSLPSSPLDRTFQDPFNAGPSKPRRAHSPSLPPLPDGNDGDLDVKLEDEVDGDESRRTLVKELESDLDDQPEDERQCRICFSGREEEDSLGRLISPCLCTGSVRYVHVSCINAWRGTGANKKAFIECQQCHYHYHFRRTLISGLATSRPILLLSTVVLFLVLTLVDGHLLTLLLAIPAIHSRVLEPASSRMVFLGDDYGWYELEDTMVYVSSGGSLVWDVFTGAIRTFATVAGRLSHSRTGVLASLPDFAQWLGVRFLLGMSVLGSFSFITLLFSLPLFGPMQIANGIRSTGIFGKWARRGRNEGTGVGQYMMIVIVIIGSIKTLFSVYHTVERLTQRLLKYVETQILEVNPQDRAEARKRKNETWRKRWIREKRYLNREGWQEIWFRMWISFKGELSGFKERFMRWKAAWALGVDEDMLDGPDELI